MNYSRYVLLLAISIFSLFAHAYDFSVTVGNQKLYFDITNKQKKTACVTFNGIAGSRKNSELKGTVEIPSKIRHDNAIYTITAIGAKAFADANRLEGVVIPSGIESIGDFAFEGCVALKRVVFPGNEVKFGQGVFFRCTDLSSVSLGSDWKNIDLTMFRWSDKLTSISIPAKIEKIQGLKKLKRLESITVDPNNIKFSSFDGVLYSKNGKTLYGCPRRYRNEIIVREGTETISTGALIDCVLLEKIDLPESLKSVSFRETSRMKELKTIVVRCQTPLITAYAGTQKKFFFMLCNPKTEIIVPNRLKGKYIDLLPTEAGQYSDNIGSMPYEVSEKELTTKKNIKGVKNFEKY